MAPHTARPTAGRTDAWHVLGFAVAYAAAMALARAFPLGPVVLSFVWPACGVAALWLVFARTSRVRLVDVGVLAVITTVVNTATGLALGLSTWFGVVNTIQGVLGAYLLRRFVPDLWGCGGHESFTRVRSISLALVAAVVSSTAAALTAAPVLALSGATVSAESVLLHVSRNTYGFFSVVVVAHLVLWAARFGHTERAHELVGMPGPVERWALVLTTPVVYALVYFGPQLAIAWVPLTVTVWAGLRFPPLVVALQSTVGAVIAFAAMLGERGPLATTESPTIQAWLLQGVLTVTLFMGLALAASRAQLVGLIDEVDRQRRISEADNDVMATTLGALRAGLVVVSPEGTVELANGPARELLERRVLSVNGIDLGDEPGWDALWSEVLGRREVVELDAFVAHGHARQVLHVHAVPLERTRGFVVHLADVTAQTDARDELVGFAAHAAHDLRGPLMAVRGWLDLLRAHLDQGMLKVEEGRLFVARASDTADRMTTLLNDLVEHAAGEGEQLVIEEVELTAVVTSAAMHSGVLPSVDVGALPRVRGDRTMLARVALNLVGNAAKYADPARPLALEVTARPLPSGEVEVRFRDNGIGITADERQQVFAPFHRATSQGTGNGMGLAMCRQIVARHGGTITAEGNEPEPGTTIVVTLPLDEHTRATPVVDHDSLRRLGVLSRPRA